jgi:hypothetical protein
MRHKSLSKPVHAVRALDEEGEIFEKTASGVNFR